MTKTHAKQPITEENEMEWELTCVSHGPHDDSHGSLARNLSRLLSFYLRERGISFQKRGFAGDKFGG